MSTHLEAAMAFESTPTGTRNDKSGQTGTGIEKYDKDFCVFMHVCMPVSAHARVCVCMWRLGVGTLITLNFVYWGRISPWTSQIWLSSWPTFPRILGLHLPSTEIPGKLLCSPGFSMAWGNRNCGLPTYKASTIFNELRLQAHEKDFCSLCVVWCFLS